MRRLRSVVVSGCALLGLVACKADIPDGVYACDADADCPDGFSCRAQSGDRERYCYASDESGEGGDSGTGGTNGGRGGRGGTGGAGASGEGASGEGASGEGASGEGGGDPGGTGGREPARPVAPTPASFSSVGERRGDGSFVLYDDGFERGERRCSAGGALCVTGGFSP